MHLTRNEQGPRYSIVCIIHGDGVYRYHGSSGKEHAADREVLKRMKVVAQQNANAEVFLFHQKSKNRIASFLSKADGIFYYFRDGRLARQKAYQRNNSPQRFSGEIDFYHQFCSQVQSQPIRMFFYFGHEIPEWGGKGYDASYPNQTFAVDDLALALKQMTQGSTKYDLVVLSSCFSGTPRIISRLAPNARFIIASPDNPHLSYFDLEFLKELDSSLGSSDMLSFARGFAHAAFLKLTQEVQTAVTVAVYDMDEVSDYLHFIEGKNDSGETRMHAESPLLGKHCDCALDSAYYWPQMKSGVYLFYRPPHFGPMQHQREHSGWECWNRRKFQIRSGKSSFRDKVEGTGHEVKGTVGRLTDDPRLEDEGTLEKIGDKIQRKSGQVKRDFEK